MPFCSNFQDPALNARFYSVQKAVTVHMDLALNNCEVGENEVSNKTLVKKKGMVKHK